VLGTFLLQHLCTSGKKKKIHLDHLKLGAINATFDAQPAIHDDEDITLMMFSYTVNTIPPLSYFILVRKTILEKKRRGMVVLTTKRASLGVVPVQNRSIPSSVNMRYAQ
jgi:hypothetical protein